MLMLHDVWAKNWRNRDLFSCRADSASLSCTHTIVVNGSVFLEGAYRFSWVGLFRGGTTGACMRGEWSG